MKFARWKTEKYVQELLASHREEKEVRELSKPSKLEKRFQALNDDQIPDDRRIKMVEGFLRALERDRTIPPPEKEDIKERALKILASRGLTFNPSSTKP